MKICQIIMFINYGFFAQNEEIMNQSALNYYKYLLKKNNQEKVISDEF